TTTRAGACRRTRRPWCWCCRRRSPAASRSQHRPRPRASQTSARDSNHQIGVAARAAANAPTLAAQPQARAVADAGWDRDEHVLVRLAVAEGDALLAALGGFGHGEGHRDDDVGRAQRLRAWRTEQPTTGRREVTENATRRRQRRALAGGGAPGAPHRGPGETEEHRERCERRDHDHVAADDRAPAEERLLEAPVVHVKSHAAELARQLLEDRAGPRVREEIAKEIVAVHGEVARHTGLAG